MEEKLETQSFRIPTEINKFLEKEITNLKINRSKRIRQIIIFFYSKEENIKLEVAIREKKNTLLSLINIAKNTKQAFIGCKAVLINIGTNINQVTKVVNSTKKITNFNKDKLIGEINRIEKLVKHFNTTSNELVTVIKKEFTTNINKIIKESKK